jgi:leader peptidase (prepilin peptidase)/N-methyltransferase
VEVLTACFFLAGWYVFVTIHTPAISPVAALLVWVLAYLLVSISFIDAEHMVIPVRFCYVGMVLALAGAAIDPTLVTLAGELASRTWWRGALESVYGIAMGWGVLALVVILGKKFLGEKRLRFEVSAEWRLREPESEEEELSFVIGEDALGWSELFYRASDRIEIEGHGILLDGNRTKATAAVIYRESVKIGDKQYPIADLVSLSGKADRVVIPREAMGAGDPPFLGLIGAFIGWKGVLFSLFASCLYALVAAVIGRIGFGRQLPFGPYLALGGVTWIFGGWMLWQWYFDSFIGMGPPGVGP